MSNFVNDSKKEPRYSAIIAETHISIKKYYIIIMLELHGLSIARSY
jgi:hypothetical protein